MFTKDEKTMNTIEDKFEEVLRGYGMKLNRDKTTKITEKPDGQTLEMLGIQIGKSAGKCAKSN